MDWREDANSLSEVVDKLYSLPGKLMYTDITFILSDGREVEAHKLILALASPVFETEFYGGQWMEESCKRLVIEDDMGVFTEFISFIYKQSIDLSVMSDFQLWDLLYLANKYLIYKLISFESITSEDFIQNVLPSSNIMEREKVKKVTKQSFENKTVDCP